MKSFIVRNQSSEEVCEMAIRGVIDAYFDWENLSASDTEQKVLRELAAIPVGKKIKLTVSSEGGRVGLALGIHNALETRAKDITVHNAGYMLSSATLLPPAKSRVVSPKSSVWMIHKPMMDVSGNSNDLESGMQCLESHEKAMASIYSERTGKSMKAVREMMSANNGRGTWMSGDEAVEEGFADDDGDGDEGTSATAKIDTRIYATLGKIPERFKDRILAAAAKRDTPEPVTIPHQPITTAAASPSATSQGGGDNGGRSATPTKPKENTMHKIITALVAAGFKLQAEATEEQVSATVGDLIATRDSLLIENKDLKTKEHKARLDRISAHVQTKVDAKIIKPELKDRWVESIMKDETSQGLLDAMDAPVTGKAPRGAAPPPAEPQDGGKKPNERLAEIREAMITETDPDKISAMAKEARGLRGHGDLFSHVK